MTTISPAEFGVLVDLALNANAPVGRVLQFGDLFQRASKLANTTGNIGALSAPVGAIPTPPALGGLQGSHVPTYADTHRLNDPITLSDN